jgi:hypothetical protein
MELNWTEEYQIKFCILLIIMMAKQLVQLEILPTVVAVRAYSKYIV